VEYLIRHYDLEEGALEIQYIEEWFGEFRRRKTAAEITRRLCDRDHIILMAEAPLPDDPGGQVIPVSYPKLADLVERLSDAVDFNERKILYSWIGATRRDWRGQGHFRALTEQQEVWAIGAGFDEVVVKTKNRFFDMRGTLDTLGFEVVKFERHPVDNGESKVYLSKRLGPAVLDSHRSVRTVVRG
jgi:GNAT superfamily N-acetyltransferase